MDKDERDAEIRHAAETLARQEGKTEKLREDGEAETRGPLDGPDPLEEPWSGEDTRLLLRWLVVVAVVVLAVGAVIVAF